MCVPWSPTYAADIATAEARPVGWKIVADFPASSTAIATLSGTAWLVLQRLAGILLVGIDVKNGR